MSNPEGNEARNVPTRVHVYAPLRRHSFSSVPELNRTIRASAQPGSDEVGALTNTLRNFSLQTLQTPRVEATSQSRTVTEEDLVDISSGSDVDIDPQAIYTAHLKWQLGEKDIKIQSQKEAIYRLETRLANIRDETRNLQKMTDIWKKRYRWIVRDAEEDRRKHNEERKLWRETESQLKNAARLAKSNKSLQSENTHLRIRSIKMGKMIHKLLNHAATRRRLSAQSSGSQVIVDKRILKRRIVEESENRSGTSDKVKPGNNNGLNQQRIYHNLTSRSPSRRRVHAARCKTARLIVRERLIVEHSQLEQIMETAADMIQCRICLSVQRENLMCSYCARFVMCSGCSEHFFNSNNQNCPTCRSNDWWIATNTTKDLAEQINNYRAE